MRIRLTLRAPLAALLLAVALAGCSEGFRNTLLPMAADGAPPLEYRLVIPDGYEVRSVDYDASLVGIASGENTSTTVSGRGIVAVYAVEVATGAEVVLVYDDVAARPTPTAILRLERAVR